MDSQVRFFGRPTGPDVDALIKEVQSTDPGTKIKYTTISDVIHERIGTSRFNTVVKSFRRRMYKERNVWFTPESGVGLVISDNHQRISHANNSAHSAIRKMVRGGDLAMKTTNDGLDSNEIRMKDHLVKTAASIKGAFIEAKKQIQWECIDKAKG